MMKKIQVNKAITRLIDTTFTDYFAINISYNTYTSDGESESKTFQVNKNVVMQEISEMVGTWYYVYDDRMITWLPELSPQACFADCFKRYKEHCSINLSKVLTAYESEYNPIENYNGVENSTESYTNYKDEKTISGKVKQMSMLKTRI